MKTHQAPPVTLSLIGLIIVGIYMDASHSSQAAGENWPQWRGPYQTGVSDSRKPTHHMEWHGKHRLEDPAARMERRHSNRLGR